MPRYSLSRRTFLRGTLGGLAIAVGLPPLEAMFNANGTAHADLTPSPKRFGVYFWGNGVRLDRWVPASTGAGWTLTDELLPLASVKNYINVVSGMQCLVNSNRMHQAGTCGILSADKPLFRETCGDSTFTTFSSPSIDQVVAQVLGNVTRFPSLELGVSQLTNQFSGTTLEDLSHNGPDSPNPPEYSPHAVFNRLFGPFFVLPGMVAPPDPTLASQRSVLDAVTADAMALRGRLGTVDRARLDEHLSAIRVLERQLAGTPVIPASSATCAQPTDPGVLPAVNNIEPLGPRARAMADLAVMAMACDLTRVFSVLFNGGNDSSFFAETICTGEFHQTTHEEPPDQPMIHSIVVFIIQQLAYLLERMNSVPEGDGTLLDHACVLATTDVSEGYTHSLTDYPILVAGRAGGTLRYPGVHYRSATAESTTNLLLTVLQAMGLPITQYGVDECLSSTNVPDILAQRRRWRV